MRLQISKEHPQSPDAISVGASFLVVLEIFVATLFVVGLFDAAFQPWGWPCVLQIGLCAALGPLLWLADSNLQQIAATTTAEVDAGGREFGRDTLS